MANKKSSSAWLQRQKNDPYVKASKKAGYRSRASFKLEELHKKYRLLKPGMNVVDLGAAPGGWSQVASKLVSPKGKVWALDLLPMAPISQVTFIQGDFTDAQVQDELISLIGDSTRIDWVLSDMSPNITGTRAIDQPKMMSLLDNVWYFAQEYLSPKGGLLVKAFQGEGLDEFVKCLKVNFEQVIIKKPDSSRAESRELYLLARGYNI